MSIASILLLLIPVLVSIWACKVIAKKKNLNVNKWQIMACILGPLAIAIILLVSAKKHHKSDD